MLITSRAIDAFRDDATSVGFAFAGWNDGNASPKTAPRIAMRSTLRKAVMPPKGPDRAMLPEVVMVDKLLVSFILAP